MALLRPEDLAREMAVSRATVYRWIQERAVPYVKLGHLVRFDAQAIARWIEAKKVVSIREAVAAAGPGRVPDKKEKPT